MNEEDDIGTLTKEDMRMMLWVYLGVAAVWVIAIAAVWWLVS